MAAGARPLALVLVHDRAAESPRLLHPASLTTCLPPHDRPSCSPRRRCSRAARTRARLAELQQPYVVAADGGAATALAFGYQPDVVVGDLDSIDAATLAELRRRGVPIETHPRDKDATDGQLAIERALAEQPDRSGAAGIPRRTAARSGAGRRSASDAHRDPGRRCSTSATNALLVRPGVEFAWRPEADEIVSLIPLGGDVDGVRTRGLRWPLAS